MFVRIGVSDTPKEIEVELDDGADTAKIKKEVEAVLAKGEGVLWLADKKGREVGVPAARIAYVDLGEPAGPPRIGFGA